MKNTKRKGFTIVELVIVIAVIAILAAVLIPTFASVIKKANESVDIQATKNMNTFLAAGNATGDVKSILDVYDIFEDSDYVIENYEPLYKGRGFFYSVEDKVIVYVDSETGKVLFPEGDLKDTTQGNKTWLSLSMKGVESKQPEGTNYKKDEASDGINAKITATVSKAEEYLYVIEQYNELSNDGATALDLDLTINGTIDMKGTQCTIGKAKNSIITIKGTNNGTLKNITSVETHGVSNANAQNEDAKYYASALIGDANNAKVTISNLTLENTYVRTFDGGNVGLLIGSTGKDATISNVTIKNSEVIGHRNVGALMGAQQGGKVTLSDNITLENVSVKTIGGKAARLIGMLSTKGALTVTGSEITVNSSGYLTTTGLSLTQTNVSLEIYMHDESEQSFDTTYSGTGLNAKDPTKYITSNKEGDQVTYPFYEDIDVLFVQTPSNSTDKTTSFAGYSISSAN